MLVVNNNHHSFEDVKAWQLARKFRKLIYNISNNFPKKENYCLTSQIRRAAISIHSNIAEGYGRYNFQENIQFCRIARGSLIEVLDQLYVALDENYISLDDFRNIYKEGKATEKAINGYIGFLKKQRNKIIK
ncbi:four helix bundle protein [Patescibacteria group bacterium]|nr:four helix bundle protein [Candidatus Falkowbacteria bacterium]MBU3906545.1 four helix bundle protein [Patescibacteria group bacterium]MCG2698137.1 four helix bundle protein [Candidatus Parcubacteria bacterium]MBU4014659.1 four helix bundle protein [Patescibacteria group bacterium]MBU4026579.1 four helix bundle protein [Patescibacteria group bacterium]